MSRRKRRRSAQKIRSFARELSPFTVLSASKG